MADYKLFYAPGTCALAVHAALNAINANYELILTKIDGVQNRAPEYLKYNPLGQVPVLVEGEKILRESAAIMLHLLEGTEFLPKNGDERVKAIQWLMFFNSSMHPAYGGYFFLSKQLPAPEEAKNLFIKRINKLWRYVEDELKTEFVAGNKPTAADILMTVIANWLPNVVIGEKTKEICRKVSALPYFTKSLEEEGIKYRVI